MRNKRLLGTVVGVLVVAIVAFLAVGLIFEDSLPGRMLRGTTVSGGKQPVYASATVDGNMGEWDLNADFFGDMYRAHKADKKVETKLYLRYDCGAGVMYALVLSAGDWPVLVQDGEAWLALDSASNKVVFSAFAWVDQGYDGDGGHARGWEASFPVGQGTRTIFAHVNVWDDGASQTSGTPKTGNVVTMSCYTPTAVFITSLTAKQKGSNVLLRWETGSEVNNMGFNLFYAASQDGPWSQINAQLIPSKVEPGSPSGAKYKFQHRDVPAGPAFYLLEDLDSSGVKTQHGPIQP